MSVSWCIEELNLRSNAVTHAEPVIFGIKNQLHHTTSHLTQKVMEATTQQSELKHRSLMM